MREYKTVDKTDWKEGPWKNEPDKIQWVDEETDLDCLMVRNHFGVWCGYVGVESSHPLYGKNYNDVPGDIQYEVHGGLTYSDKCQEGPEETVVCHIPESGRSEDIWWFGFDCGQHMDYMPGIIEGGHDFSRWGGTYRDVEYVTKQVTNLAKAIKEYGQGIVMVRKPRRRKVWEGEKRSSWKKHKRAHHRKASKR